MANINAKEWDDALNHFIGLSSTTLRRNKELEIKLARLEYELAQWQRHSASLQAAHKDQAPLILCVIDATGDTFSADLVSQGVHGGREMGQHLARSIVNHLARENVQFIGRPSFWVTIYWNKAAMAENLLKTGECMPEQLEQFCTGFSQSSSRFLLVDVGSSDDTAVEKVKEYLDTYIRFPQTLRVFFGATHANRYLALLTLLDKERYLDKLVLLQSRSKGVGELAVLRLPSISVEGIFVGAISPPTPDSMPSPIARPTVNTTINAASGLPSPDSPTNTRFPSGNLRPIDPTKPLHRQEPPPCNEFYLMTCTKGAECKYCHDYLLTREELETLAANARKAPCNFLKKGLPCENGPSCCWGHECPNGQQCFHYSKGKCWFKTEGMHNREGPLSPI